VDNHPVHRSKEVHKFVFETEAKLKIFYLPPYSPELNPDELVRNYLKNTTRAECLMAVKMSSRNG
jgi:transposase